MAKLPNVTKRLTDLLRAGSLMSRLRRIFIKTAAIGLGSLPTSQALVPMASAAAPSSLVVTPVIINRDKRDRLGKLIFRVLNQQDNVTMFAQHRSHSSHSSHRSHSSHYSSTSGGGVAPPATTQPKTEANKTPANEHIQKLTVQLSLLDLKEKSFTAKDDFGTEYKFFYSGSTKIVTVGVGGNTMPVAAIHDSNLQSYLLKKGQDLSVIWEKQGTKRKAVEITILE
jgi:hypothetical protein